MIKAKKYLISFLFVLIVTLGGIMTINFTTSPFNVNADAAIYYSEEKYTNSDYLLLDDGTESLTKTIKDFSEEVKAAPTGIAFPELSQVIPLEYLESSEEGEVFQYNGKEYGFYVAKDGNYFDVLLIDFVYEFEDNQTHSNIEYKIRIKPILQQTFLRGVDDTGNYIWTKSELGSYTYYVANPRFLSVIQNENSLNYGDNGYNKINDDGVIIQQYRVNYGKISYATEDDLAEIVTDFTINSLVDANCALLDELIPGAGSLIGYIKDYVELGRDIYETGKETTVLADNENNIQTRFSKTEQRDNSQFEGYSRTAGFMPKEEIILSDANDSYMEMIVVLNDSNYKSRLTQFCEFDIVRRSGNYASMEYVAGNWYNEDAPALSFSKQRILFEDQQPKFEIDENNIEGIEIPIYLLANGKQTIEFEPEYSACFKFDMKNSIGLNLNVTSSEGDITKTDGYFYLEDGKKYTITVSSGDEKVITELSVSLANGIVPGTIHAYEQQLIKFNILQSDVYNLTTNHSDCVIEDIFTKTVSGLKSYSQYSEYSPHSTVSVPLDIGEYYVLIKNTVPADAIFSFDVAGCFTGDIEKTNEIETDGVNYVYIKFNIEIGSYTGTVLNAENYKILNSDMEPLSTIRYSNGNFDVENSGDAIYIGVLAEKGNTNVLLNKSENSYIWEVDGVIVENSIELERGHDYTIKFYINGISQGDDFIYHIDKSNDKLAEGISFSGNVLSIKDYCPTNESFTIAYSLSATAESKSKLEITPIYTITFQGISITNSDAMTFSWVQTNDLATIYYTLSNSTKTYHYSVNTINYISGDVYSHDITGYLDAFGMSNLTISIDKIGIKTSKGIQEIELTNHYAKTVHAAYGDGNGTKNSPFTISCSRHFKNLELNKSNNNYFKITEYFSLEGTVIENFYGVLDVKNAIAIHWTPTKTRYVGIIVNNFGTIRNLQVNITDKIIVTGLDSYTVGGIACYNKAGGIIENCSVPTLEANIGFMATVGSLVGINEGIVRDCWAYADVTTSGAFGVIVGINYGEISGCCGMGDITQRQETYESVYQSSYLGGIAGINSSGGVISNCVGGTIEDSYLKVVIDVPYVDNDQLAPYSGPIAGENNGTIANCSNYGYHIDTGNLHSWRSWFVKYNQLRNINNTI